MDNKGSAVVIHQMLFDIQERQEHFLLYGAITAHRDIRHITGVWATGGQNAMLAVPRDMSASGFEPVARTIAGFVQVHRDAPTAKQRASAEVSRPSTDAEPPRRLYRFNYR